MLTQVLMLIVATMMRMMMLMLMLVDKGYIGMNKSMTSHGHGISTIGKDWSESCPHDGPS